MIEYQIDFNFNCVNKKGLVSGKSGSVFVTAEKEITPETKDDTVLLSVIAQEMALKTKKQILSVEILSVEIIKLIKL